VSDTYYLADNGTLKEWAVKGIPLLFPEQTLLINGEEKLRGGAPVCCPLFGKMPDTPAYAGIDLPQHGLVRLGNKHTNISHTSQRTIGTMLDSYDHYEHYQVWYEKPWKHSAIIVFKTANNDMFLSHMLGIRLSTAKTFCQMPYSFCLHPYFDTKGEVFTIQIHDRVIHSNMIQEGISELIPLTGTLNRKVFIHLTHGIITIDLFTADRYSHICIWTDCVNKYICVEPVLWHEKQLYLYKGHEEIFAHCYLHFRPK
jgi:galactose mutarotase-like enzyme